MPYLIYSPGSNNTTKPTYAVGHLDPVDEIVLQDLRKWGWRVEETTSDDPKWLTAIQDYHARMKKPVEDGEQRTLSLWEFWRSENTRILVEDGGRAGKKRNRLVKRPSSSSSRSSFLGFGRRRDSGKPPKSNANTQPVQQEEQETKGIHGANRERRTVGEIRQGVEQRQAAAAAQRNAEEATRQLRELPQDGRPIFKYGNQTSVGASVQMDKELIQEIADWDGAGILRTTQISVVSEEGIAVDERGERVRFNPVPGWDLGLFPWSEDAERSNSTKSKDPAPSNLDDLQYVSGDFAEVFEVADKYQKEDQYD